MSHKVVCVTFANNNLLSQLFGEHDRNLYQIEKKLEVFTSSRGNTISISGHPDNVNKAKLVIESLYSSIEKGMNVNSDQLESIIRIASLSPNEQNDFVSDYNEQNKEGAIKTRKKNIVPYTNTQYAYIQNLRQKDIVFAKGPAGTGKTYLAVAMAVSMFLNKEVDRIILSRPAVEAGEKLGFLPGDIKEKIDPYLRPLYDALHDMVPAELLNKYIENGEIEIAPLAFMRGRTLNSSFIILDEAQNTTPTQMKMFLTRLGEASRIVVTGDPSQIDLPPGSACGLIDATTKLKDIPEIGFITFNDDDIIRHPLTAKIVQAYNQAEKK